MRKRETRRERGVTRRSGGKKRRKNGRKGKLFTTTVASV